MTPTFVNHTVLDEIRDSLRDKSGTAYDVLDEITYKKFIYANILPEQILIFQRYSTGIYRWCPTQDFYDHIFGMTIDDPEYGYTYTTYSNGTVETTTNDGTDDILTDVSGDYIEITGCLIDFGKTMADIFQHLAMNYSRDIAKSVSATSTNPGDIRRELLHLASISLGVRGVQ